MSLPAATGMTHYPLSLNNINYYSSQIILISNNIIISSIFASMWLHAGSGLEPHLLHIICMETRKRQECNAISGQHFSKFSAAGKITVPMGKWWTQSPHLLLCKNYYIERSSILNSLLSKTWCRLSCKRAMRRTALHRIVLSPKFSWSMHVYATYRTENSGDDLHLHVKILEIKLRVDVRAVA